LDRSEIENNIGKFLFDLFYNILTPRRTIHQSIPEEKHNLTSQN